MFNSLCFYVTLQQHKEFVESYIAMIKQLEREHQKEVDKVLLYWFTLCSCIQQPFHLT